MFADQPSRTLLSTAIRRATHQLLDAPVILEDPIALRIVPEAAEAELVAGLNRDGTPDAALLRALFVMRSRFAEDRLADAAARGNRQYVMLGAGLDTFPWRQPPFARSMRLFAADFPTSLSFARERARSAGLSEPDNLTRVPIDLETGDVMGSLVHAGLDPEVPSFFSILGVTQYLSPGAVCALFRDLSAMPPASETVLSFALPDAALSGQDLTAARLSAAFTAKVGEPWRTRMHPRDLIGKLAEFGYHEIFHLTPEIAHQRYFSERQDGLRVPGWEQLIAAVR
jgi:methyltransferase (TIGR00027 family)